MRMAVRAGPRRPRCGTPAPAARRLPPRSVVAGDAVERRRRARGDRRRVDAVGAVRGPVTLHAPAHAERGRRRREADEVQQIVEAVRALDRRDPHELLDLAVARLAGEAGPDVPPMLEVDELRHLVDAHPGDRLPALPVALELLDFRVADGGDDLVAAHAALRRRQPRVLRPPRVYVAVLTADLEGAGMDQVAEEDRLDGRARRIDRPREDLARLRPRPGERPDVGQEVGDLLLAEVRLPRGHERREPDGGAALPDREPNELVGQVRQHAADRKSTRLNSSHPSISYAVFCLKKKILS